MTTHTKTPKERATNILNIAAKEVWKQMGYEDNNCPEITPDKLRQWMPPIFQGELMPFQGIEYANCLEIPRDDESGNWSYRAWYRLVRCQQQHADEVPIQTIDITTQMKLFPEDTEFPEDTGMDVPTTTITNKVEIRPRYIATYGMIAILCGWNNESELNNVKEHTGLSSLEEGVVAIHNLWEVVVKDKHKDEFYHPIETIVEAYLEHYQLNNAPTKAIEKRQKQIAPAFIKEAFITTKERLPIGTFHQQGSAITPLHLPTFENTEDNSIIHALPLELYEGQKGGGRGAPLDERIFFNALLACPYGKPEPFNAIRLEPRLSDYVNWLYPNGWNRTLQLPRLQRALYEVHNKRISYERRSWNVVQVLAMPEQTTQMDDLLPLIIRFPDGVEGNGPLIDVHRMRLYGLQSAQKWRAWIRLHYLWDTAKQRNGGYPIYATIPEVKRNSEGYLLNSKEDIITSGDIYRDTKGKRRVRKGNEPQTKWYHPDAILTGGNERNTQCNKIPVLTPQNLVALFFDDKHVDNTTFRKRLYDARGAAMDMEEDGVILIEYDTIDTKKEIKGWRIIQTYQSDNVLQERTNP